MASVSFIARYEPRARSNDRSRAQANEVRDPLWFLTRQWQMGEFRGQDAGSIAYVEYYGRSTTTPRWKAPDLGGGSAAAEQDVEPGRPLEAQTLSELIEPDLSLRVQLGQDFDELLRNSPGGEALAEAVSARLLDVANSALERFRLKAPPDEELNPLDAATRRFLSVCVGRAVDGFELSLLAKEVAGGAPIPAEMVNSSEESTRVAEALALLLEQTERTFGAIGVKDAEAWDPARLEYQLEVVAADPGGKGNATMSATPSALGEFDWHSFDVTERDESANESPPEPVRFTFIPSDVHFPGEPNPRFWYIEENTLSLPDVQLLPSSIAKLLSTQALLTHGAGWYVMPFDQEIGTAVKTDALIVYDVFGSKTLVERADKNAGVERPERWTMYSHADRSAGAEELSGYFLLPQSAGELSQDGPVLEDVRFGRDEMANLTFGIERTTLSPIGEPRPGRERDADIAARQMPPEPVPSDPEALLRYQIQGEVPANWIPFLGVRGTSENASDPVLATDPSIILEKASSVRPAPGGAVRAVFSVGRIMDPENASRPYRIFEEEVPRTGLRLERAVTRTRWLDGSTHLWVSRRRRFGAGEAQSGLRFDSALPNESQG